MHITTVVGGIHPEAGGWYFNEPVIAMHGGEEIQMAVKHSKFTIRVTSPGDEEVDGDWFRQVWLRASAALRSALDALGFYEGAALEVEFVGATYDNKGVIFEEPVRPLFAIVPEPEVPAEKLSTLVWHAIGNAHVRHALSDVRQALQLDADSGFYCYRAIESMRQQYLEGDEENDTARKQSWQRLREALCVSKADIDVIKEAAKSRRHGGAESVSYAECIEHVKWTRDLLLRFVEALPQAGPDLAQLDV